MGFKFSDNTIMYWLRVSINSQAAGREATPAEIYAALELYYLNNGLYDIVAQAAHEGGIWTEAMKPMRNPANRVVEFYVSKLWPGDLPGALPIVTDNKAIVDPIHQIWAWSSWATKKQLAARWFGLFGDLLIKVVTSDPPDRVYFQLIKPNLLTDFDEDDRGFLQYIRLDIPQTRRVNGKVEAYNLTEVWDKEAQLYRLWEHNRAANTPLDQLPKPKLTQPMSDFGIDFLPFVHAKFRDLGEKRGAGSFVHALDKIDEANRKATRLAQMLFRYNRPVMGVTAGGNDSSGRPLPAPRLGGSSGTDESDSVTLGDDTILRLPGNSQAFALVPNVNYESALNILNADLMELEKDLPELAYYRLRDLGANISGRAVRLMLSDAIDKVIEARGNAEAALVRANQMALTIGQNAGLFTGLGTFEAGNFDHEFGDREVIATTGQDKAETVKAYKDAGVPLPSALRLAGFTEAEIEAIEDDRDSEAKRVQQTFGQAMAGAQRNFDQGNNPPQNGNQGNQGNEDE